MKRAAKHGRIRQMATFQTSPIYKPRGTIIYFYPYESKFSRRNRPGAMASNVVHASR